MPLDMVRMVRLNNSELERLDSRIDKFAVLSRGTSDGDALGACTRDGGILVDDEGWLCLLYSASSGSSWDAGDPGLVGGRCLHVCCDCLCVIASFRDVKLLFRDWAALSPWTGTEIGNYGVLGLFCAHCLG